MNTLEMALNDEFEPIDHSSTIASDLVQLAATHGIQRNSLQILSIPGISSGSIMPPKGASCIICPDTINKIRALNSLFRTVHSCLPDEGLFIGTFEPMHVRYQRLWERYPSSIAQLYYLVDYALKRAIPGLVPHHELLGHRRFPGDRVLSITEILGRLVYCGFEIVEYQTTGDYTYVVSKKVREISTDPLPTSGPLLRLPRVGQGGKPLSVLKLRTMHPYAQYLQEHVYKSNGLSKGGKLAEDFRITPWGKTFRAFWLDEIPMLINVLKRELKLVGVRPLSDHYMGLYTDEHRERRIRYKPGLFPPFYADMPDTLEEIMASEAKYLDHYDEAPISTDVRYLLLGIYNILVKRARSK